MWSIKGEICAINDMNRINKIRNRLDVLDVIRSFSMTYSSKSIQFPVCAQKLSHVLQQLGRKSTLIIYASELDYNQPFLSFCSDVFTSFS